MKPVKALAAAVLGLAALAPLRNVLAETPDSTRWIVTTARGHGARGEQYFSTVRVHNPNAVDATASWSFLPQSPLDASGRALGDNSNAPSAEVTIPAGGSVELASFWPEPGANLAGAVRVTSTTTDSGGRPLPLTARSVTRAFRPSPAGVVLGPLIEGVSAASLIGAGETGRIPDLQAGQSDDNTFRSNVFLLSTNAAEETELTLTLLDGDGASRGEKTTTLGRLAQTQLNDVARAFGYVPCLHGCPSGSLYPEPIEVLVRVVRGGPVVAAGVLIENESGSNLFVPSVKTTAP